VKSSKPSLTLKGGCGSIIELGGWFEAFDGECLVENGYCDGIRAYNRRCHIGGVSETLISHSMSNVLGPGRRMMLEGRLQLRRGKVRQSITTPARGRGKSRGCSQKSGIFPCNSNFVAQSLPILDARIHVGCWNIHGSKYPLALCPFAAPSVAFHTMI
jgi:hypothetical protein